MPAVTLCQIVHRGGALKKKRYHTININHLRYVCEATLEASRSLIASESPFDTINTAAELYLL